MVISQQAVVKACEELGLDYKIIHRDKISVYVKIGKHNLFFIHKRNPFNRTDVRRITSDKDLTHTLFSEKVNTPRWKAFLDPYINDIYPIEAEGFPTKTMDVIIEEIQESFEYPLIIKPNMKSRGINVFKVKNEDEIQPALLKIFDQKDKDYDYIALAQDFVDIDKEFRVVAFRKKVILVYEKFIENASFTGNLSPLHWEGAKAVHITDMGLIDTLEKFTYPIYENLDLEYAGFDIAIDKQGKMWLIEINSQPQIEIFVRDNGLQPVVDMNVKIFKELAKD